MQNENDPALRTTLRSPLSFVAVCDDCHRCWPVCHIDARTDELKRNEHADVLRFWLELHLWCKSVRFCSVVDARGAAYDPMAGNGERSRMLEELREIADAAR